MPVNPFVISGNLIVNIEVDRFDQIIIDNSDDLFTTSKHELGYTLGM